MPQPQTVQPLLDFFKNASYLGLIYTFLKDQGRGTRTRQIIEMARNRMAFWDTRLKVQLSVLEGAELEAAKAEALAAGDEIRISTDGQLAIVNRKTSKRMDLPWWKRVTLFYKPAVKGRLVKAATYYGRIMYWLAAASVFVEVICIPLWIGWLYAHESASARAQEHGVLVSLLAAIGFAVVVSGFSCIVFYNSARDETEISKVEPLTNI